MLRPFFPEGRSRRSSAGGSGTRARAVLHPFCPGVIGAASGVLAWLGLALGGFCVFALPTAVGASTAGSAAAAGAFPKPEPQRACAELKLYDVRGLPWRTPREDWDGALQRVASDPAWQSWLRAEREEVGQWRERRRDRVEWVAGDPGDFVSPRDGSPVVFSPDYPGGGAAPLATATDPRVECTPRLLAAWVHHFRQRHAVFMERAARLYRLTGDADAAAWAAEQLDFYVAGLRRWPERQDGSRLHANAVAEAATLARHLQVARLLWDYAGLDRRQRWYRGLFGPEAEIVGRSGRTINHGACWQRSAAAQVALLFADADLWREAVDGAFGLRAQLEKGVTSDYFWCEQSFEHAWSVVQACAGLFELAGLTGRSGDLARELALVQNLFLAPAWLRFPDGTLPNPGDSVGAWRNPDAEACASLYRLFPTPLGLVAASKRRDWATLLDAPWRPPRPVDQPVVVSARLDSSRLALLRRGSWQVFLHVGQLTASGAQAEALNFSASCGDAVVTRDAGAAPGGSPLREGYFATAPAQNSLLVNGEGQEAAHPGELSDFDPNLARMTALQPKYQPGARARRTLAIEGGRLVDTATIQVSGSRPQVLGLTLHLQGAVESAVALQPDPAFARQRAAPFGYWRDVRGANFRDRAEFVVRCGGRTLRLSFACPGEFRLWLARTPDMPPALRESFYLETLGVQTTFTTRFQPED